MSPTSQNTVAYDVHPTVSYAQRVIENMADRTGKTLIQWVRLVKRDGPDDPKACRAWLKSEHDVGGTTASFIVDQVAGKPNDFESAETYLSVAPTWVEAMYDGPKAALRPIHDALIEMGRAIAADVRICPCRTIVPLYRERVFAEIKPSTRTRVDLGLALKGCSKRLIKRIVATGGLEKGDRITHRIPITSLDEIDRTVERWLGIAYELDATS